MSPLDFDMTTYNCTLCSYFRHNTAYTVHDGSCCNTYICYNTTSDRRGSTSSSRSGSGRRAYPRDTSSRPKPSFLQLPFNQLIGTIPNPVRWTRGRLDSTITSRMEAQLWCHVVSLRSTYACLLSMVGLTGMRLLAQPRIQPLLEQRAESSSTSDKALQYLSYCIVGRSATMETINPKGQQHYKRTNYGRRHVQ